MMNHLLPSDMTIPFSAESLQKRLHAFIHPSLLSSPFFSYDLDDTKIRFAWYEESFIFKLAPLSKPSIHPSFTSFYIDPGHVGPHLKYEGRSWIHPLYPSLRITESLLNMAVASNLLKFSVQSPLSLSLSRQASESSLGFFYDQLFVQLKHFWPSSAQKFYQIYLSLDLQKRATFLAKGCGLSIHFNADGHIQYQDDHPVLEQLSSANIIMAFVNGGYRLEDIRRKGFAFFLFQLIQPFWEESLLLAQILISHFQKDRVFQRVLALPEHHHLSYLTEFSVYIQPGVFARPLRVLQNVITPQGPRVLMEGDMLNTQVVLDFMQIYGQQAFVDKVSEAYWNSLIDFSTTLSMKS